MTFLNDDERARISQAISAAEQMSSGEIVAVVAPASASYAYVPFLWAAMLALLVPWPLIHFTWWPVQTVYLIQLAVFLLVLVALWPKATRARLVPKAVRDSHVERRASDQFLTQDLHTTRGRTGVLIFVSMLERRAVICADAGIDAVVMENTWQDIVDKLTQDLSENRPAEGFIAAINAIGDILAKHFPPGARDENSLPDHLIVLSE